MAKRASNRTSAEDSGAAAPTQPKPRRAKATASASPDTDPSAVYSGEASENNRDGIPSEAGDDAPLESTSMGSEPSEEDIRMRAYHRYLERGGGHGMDFEDWLEAERELKPSKFEA
jgi:hypothetical protein